MALQRRKWDLALQLVPSKCLQSSWTICGVNASHPKVDCKSFTNWIAVLQSRKKHQHLIWSPGSLKSIRSSQGVRKFQRYQFGFSEHESCLKTGWFYRAPKDLTHMPASLKLVLKFFRKWTLLARKKDLAWFCKAQVVSFTPKGSEVWRGEEADRWWVNSFLSFQFSRSFVLFGGRSKHTNSEFCRITSTKL